MEESKGERPKVKGVTLVDECSCDRCSEDLPEFVAEFKLPWLCLGGDMVGCGVPVGLRVGDMGCGGRASLFSWFAELFGLVPEACVRVLKPGKTGVSPSERNWRLNGLDMACMLELG